MKDKSMHTNGAWSASTSGNLACISLSPFHGRRQTASAFALNSAGRRRALVALEGARPASTALSKK